MVALSCRDRVGKELDWWAKIGIEPLKVARQLWLSTHPRPSPAMMPSDARLVELQKGQPTLRACKELPLKIQLMSRAPTIRNHRNSDPERWASVA